MADGHHKPGPGLVLIGFRLADFACRAFNASTAGISVGSLCLKGVSLQISNMSSADPDP